MRLVGTGAGKAIYNKIKDNINDIHGLPPNAYWEAADGIEAGTGANPALAAFPIVILKPALPKFGPTGGEVGLTLFSAEVGKDAEKRYKEIVSEIGIGARTDPEVYLAILNDTTISESFNNDYGESTFESKIHDMLPKGALREIGMIAGGGKSVAGGVSNIGQEMGGTIGKIIDSIGKVGSVGENVLNKVTPGGSGSALLAGSMVDFPMIWQGTSYSASYSFTVRLCNPNPKDPQAYFEFILEPLARILAFVVPYSNSEYTYNFPLLADINCPGLFHLEAGAVTGIDVIKGGEYNSITWQQQPAIIDLKITVNNLYSTMSSSNAGAAKNSQRPTLKKYFESLQEWANYQYPNNDSACGEPGPPPPQTNITNKNNNKASNNAYQNYPNDRPNKRIPSKISAIQGML